jgi:negative regulator of flagellin synthesis FlgM
MSNKIGGIEQRPLPVSSSAPAPRVRDAVSQGGKGAATPDDVMITETARELAALETRLAGLPAINDLRVAAVRRQIDEGRYQVDPQRVAEKVVRLERDLAAVVPKAKDK